MKVVSGKFRGLNLKAVPTNNTRPTSAKVKEAVFSMLTPYMVDQGVALDLFAGTGSLGIEAVSRDYRLSYLVDKAYKAVNTIKENVEKTRSADNFVILKTSAVEALKKFQADGIKFDLVFLDPPYRMKITEQIIKDMVEGNLLNDGAIIVDETDYDIDLTDFSKINLLKEKRYKDTKVAMYQFGG
ncbi:16S rRNA (guanine(966)-N(2))-methyltransferase RsmD [Companilactobacillus alimentarius]|uniref:16S rRNA (Guanine(966)-N(2))-methyltransferase RsmD n=1 Tax=Companilactobacillus alimentarius DSM 20249 TaxID=1423720 RepID=A0A2K9HEL9_9LACO|nr:16S rRNA (guanine(966)-N(2))-methyltransferase RsmD [Companilactobacillus alimentarius]AUI71011.1 16S rRNA (guanine(966)-N(2))-methyltransferase RsmD [Companilactobacillus alimentarius DSM 20249]KRK75125.1 putative N6-adenine-specific methylase (putative) [Companilactobacillus alimentarius DSM 20249]MDT6951737.1 16S rRNA (guanine(966)-N(2))-methyltransferase RsmD [Companilactobacillus alimentarius]GEO44099.1 rRNA methyltransferase [Companilactobacillus alimentarius]